MLKKVTSSCSQIMEGLPLSKEMFWYYINYRLLENFLLTLCSSSPQSLCLEIEQIQKASDVAELERWNQVSTKAREELATLQCTLGSMKAYQVGASCSSLKGLHSEIYMKTIL